MVELQSVDYSIAGRLILQGVSLSVGERETLAILGASGSGKSTILRVILGLAWPDAGHVLVAGKDLGRLQYDELVEVRKRIGIVFQDGALFDSLTVGENVGYYFMEHNSRTHEQVEPEVREMLRTVGLGHTLDMMPDELSGGMRRRVAIARALIYRPSLILYDEPTTGLDPVARESILELINRLKHEHHVASVLVTHSLDDAAKVADRFVVIRAGRVVWAGSRRQFLAQQNRLVAFYQPAGQETGEEVNAR
ncbi:MAG: ATP-binding cassette domain-containing protein [candidate division FCPU426 bacterium]